MVAETGFIEVNGARLYFELAGAGPRLALLHSGIADSRMWDAQFGALSEAFRVLRYDLRGYGKSPAVPGPFSHTADLAALLAAMQFTPTALMGSSRGGTLAIDFCLEYPAYVTALVLACANPSGFTFTGAEPPQWEPMVAAFKADDFTRAAELEAEIWLVGPHRRPQQVPETLRGLVQEMDKIALRNEAHGGMQELPPPQPALGRLGEIQIPVLVVCGLLDDPNMPVAARRMQAGLPDARLVEFPECAHFPNLEAPERFNGEVIEFLRAAGTRS